MTPYQLFSAVVDGHATHTATRRGIHIWTDTNDPTTEYHYHGKKSPSSGQIEIHANGAAVRTIALDGARVQHGPHTATTRAAAARYDAAAGIEAGEDAGDDLAGDYRRHVDAETRATIYETRHVDAAPIAADLAGETPEERRARYRLIECKNPTHGRATEYRDGADRPAVVYCAVCNTPDPRQDEKAARAVVVDTNQSTGKEAPEMPKLTHEPNAALAVAYASGRPPIVPPPGSPATGEDAAAAWIEQHPEIAAANAATAPASPSPEDPSPAEQIEAEPAPIAPACVLGKSLREALAAVRPSVAKKSALPILATVRLIARPGCLTIQATNLETASTRHIPAVDVTEPWSLCVDFAALADAAKAAKNDTVRISPVMQSVRIAYGSSRREYPTMPATDFPHLQQPDDGAAAEYVNGPALTRLLARVAPFASKDDSRPVLAGISLQRKKKQTTIHAAAADGFTLAYDTMETATAGDLAVIIPARALDAVKAHKLPDECYLTVSPNKAAATIAYDGGAILARLIEGTFPDVHQIIPREHTGSVDVRTEKLAAAVKEAAAIAKDNNDVSRYRFSDLNEQSLSGQTDDFTFSVSATSAEAGNYAAPVPAETWTGYPVEIALNARYMLAALAAAQSDRVRIETNSPHQAIAVRSIGRDDVTVIMPMVIGAT